jgi:cbb3-type cytochrome oxidase subunit 1
MVIVMVMVMVMVMVRMMVRMMMTLRGAWSVQREHVPQYYGNLIQ